MYVWPAPACCGLTVSGGAQSTDQAQAPQAEAKHCAQAAACCMRRTCVFFATCASRSNTDSPAPGVNLLCSSRSMLLK